MMGVPRKKNQTLRTRSLSVAALAVLASALLLSAAAPVPQPDGTPAAVSEIVLTEDPAQSTVHWTVDITVHMVHGTFTLKSGIIHFDPETVKAGGEIHVAPTSAGHGNDSVDSLIHHAI